MYCSFAYMYIYKLVLCIDKKILLDNFFFLSTVAIELDLSYIQTNDIRMKHSFICGISSGSKLFEAMRLE